MPRFVSVSPVLPGMSEEIIDEYVHRRDDKRSRFFSEAVRDYFRRVQVDNWEAWLQPLQGKDYFISSLETEDYEASYTRLRQLIAEGNPVACGLQARYLKWLGKDYGRESSIEKLSCVFDMEFPYEPCADEIVGRAFAFPLLEDKVQAYRTYNAMALTTFRERTVKNATAFGITRLTRWIQSGADGYYVVFYMEKPARRWATDRETYQQRLQDPTMQEILAVYEEHCGISAKDQYANPTVLWSAELFEPACYA